MASYEDFNIGIVFTIAQAQSNVQWFIWASVYFHLGQEQSLPFLLSSHLKYLHTWMGIQHWDFAKGAGHKCWIPGRVYIDRLLNVESLSHDTILSTSQPGPSFQFYLSSPFPNSNQVQFLHTIKYSENLILVIFLCQWVIIFASMFSHCRDREGKSFFRVLLREQRQRKMHRKHVDKFFKILERFLDFSWDTVAFPVDEQVFFFLNLIPIISCQECQLILVHYYCFPVSCATSCMTHFSPTEHLLPAALEVTTSLELYSPCPTKSTGVLPPNNAIALLTGSAPVLDCYPVLFHEVRVYRNNTAQ